MARFSEAKLSPATPPTAWPPSAWASSAPLGSLAVAWTLGLAFSRAGLDSSFGLFAPLIAGTAILLVLPGKFWTGYASALLVAFAAGSGYWHLRQEAAGGWPDLPEGTPWATIRGRIEEEPRLKPADPDDGLRSQPATATTRWVARCEEILLDGTWRPVGERVLIYVPGEHPDWHALDRFEAAGLLRPLRPPANPGGWDARRSWAERGVVRSLSIPAKVAELTRLGRGWPDGPRGWLGWLRAGGQRVVAEQVSPDVSGVAQALVLGESTRMTGADWDGYVRTGVIHVLAVSGQHLAILAVIIGFAANVWGCSLRTSSLLVVLVVGAYTLLTGANPPALRACVVVACARWAMIARRPHSPLNAFAFAWLVVGLLDPADLFTVGCQLSFLTVALLAWMLPVLRPAPREPDPVEQLRAVFRPAWRQYLRDALSACWGAYRLTLLITLIIAPMVAYWQNLVSPAALLIGPPLIVLSTIALVAGGLFLACAAVGAFVPGLESVATVVGAPPLWVLENSLRAAESVVRWADALPFAAIYLPGPSLLWVAGFYLILAVIMARPVFGERLRGERSVVIMLICWLGIGGAVSLAGLPPGELRVTFLSVGHGGCAVIETPNGRVIVYDAGSLAGPDLARRDIAPFLWARGYQRIDAVIISHADLDHFNGLGELAKRFPIGRVLTNPTFADKNNRAVSSTLGSLERRGVPVEPLSAPAVLEIDGVEFEAIHPPALGPEGIENVRSLVLEIRHAGHKIMLTGDLEGLGAAMVRQLPARKIDVWLAPHHGSAAANDPGWIPWASPKFVVASSAERGSAKRPETYLRAGVPYWATQERGAITIRSHGQGLTAESFLTGEILVVTPGGKAR